ncbi:MAG: Rrf2 family transcriptional regulator, partial [Acidimicrobiales bacterium]
MQLTYYTDYSLRVLMYLAIRRGRIANISEIAECYGISRNHLVKVVHNLARGGFINSYRGKGGGIELARDL